MKLGSLALAFALGSPTFALVPSPCSPLAETKAGVRKALDHCLSTWSGNADPADPDPPDDCRKKLEAFVKSSKLFKACRIAQVKRTS